MIHETPDACPITAHTFYLNNFEPICLSFLDNVSRFVGMEMRRLF